MSLNRVERAPLSVSFEDTEKVMRNPRFRSAVAKVNEAVDEVTSKYDIPQARERNSIEYDRLQMDLIINRTG
jgi:hypothetical protein